MCFRRRTNLQSDMREGIISASASKGSECGERRRQRKRRQAAPLDAAGRQERSARSMCAVGVVVARWWPTPVGDDGVLGRRPRRGYISSRKGMCSLSSVCGFSRRVLGRVSRVTRPMGDRRPDQPAAPR